MKYVYVPASILRVLRANQFEGREIFDVNKLLDILSPDDLSFYMWCNLQPAAVLPEAVCKSMGNALLYGQITEIERNDSAVVCPPWSQIADERAAKDVNKIVNDYCVAEKAPQLDLADQELASEIFWIEGGQITLFTHIPVSEGAEPQPMVSFYKRLMTQLLQFAPLRELAPSEIFLEYLKQRGSMLHV